LSQRKLEEFSVKPKQLEASNSESTFPAWRNGRCKMAAHVVKECADGAAVEELGISHGFIPAMPYSRCYTRLFFVLDRIL
jgi:hypothetical protein